jgi:hypothetical protein
MKHAKLQFNVLALSLLTASTAFATDGYFSHGYGVRTQATGGAGIALPQDSLARRAILQALRGQETVLTAGSAGLVPAAAPTSPETVFPALMAATKGMTKRISGCLNWATPDS